MYIVHAYTSNTRKTYVPILFFTQLIGIQLLFFPNLLSSIITSAKEIIFCWHLFVCLLATSL